MSSKFFKWSNTIGVGAILFTASAVQAADNPLHPSYYASKVTIVSMVPGGNSVGYRDSGNPLHPSFGPLNVAYWETAAAGGGTRYVDRNNPLHPSYRRI